MCVSIKYRYEFYKDRFLMIHKAWALSTKFTFVIYCDIVAELELLQDARHSTVFRSVLGRILDDTSRHHRRLYSCHSSARIIVKLYTVSNKYSILGDRCIDYHTEQIESVVGFVSVGYTKLNYDGRVGN